MRVCNFTEEDGSGNNGIVYEEVQDSCRKNVHFLYNDLKKMVAFIHFNALNGANHLSEYAANGVPMFDHDDRMQFSYMNRFRVG